VRSKQKTRRRYRQYVPVSGQKLNRQFARRRLCGDARRARGSLTAMVMSISEPILSAEGLDSLEPLWRELHLHHQAVAGYRPLVESLELSWARRREWYLRILNGDGAYFLVADGAKAAGYAMVQVHSGPDDTFEVSGGVVEIVSLAVTEDLRGKGIGTMLIDAAKAFARSRRIDTLKVAVMDGNQRAVRFYEASGFALGEFVLYHRLDTIRAVAGA
jgi:ribosomal protein S18 acetylase RimI-like enzyme